jgi:6-phosphogluconolactonase
MNIISRSAFFISLPVTLCLGGFATPAADDTGHTFHAFVGTYTGAKSKGIHRAAFDAAQGTLTEPELAFELTNPSFLAVHPDQKKLYAVGEVSGGNREGVVTALAVDPRSGRLDRLNQQSSKGSGPCHLSLDKTGRNLLVANYGSGSIACLPVDHDGRLSEATGFVQHQGSSVNPQRQRGPHAHWIEPDPSNRFALTCDLGLDQILVYQLNPRLGTLAPNTPPHTTTKPGAGPRHLAFHPNGRFAYVINELDSTMVAYTWEQQRGELKELQRLSTLPADFTGRSTCAEVMAHPSGRFLYGSNRGHDSIAVFAVDSETGRMTAVQHEPAQGKTPRFFTVDPTGRWLLACNQGSDSVVIFRIDPQSGRITTSGRTIEIASPVCLVFVPAK